MLERFATPVRQCCSLMAYILAVPGRYHFLEAVVCIDPGRGRSVVSTDFIHRHHLSFTVTTQGFVALRTASGPVEIPTRSGRYVCSYSLDVGYVNGPDVVLGRDWMVACGVFAGSPYLPDPTPECVAGLGLGFCWVPLGGRSGVSLCRQHVIFRLKICFRRRCAEQTGHPSSW